MAFFILLGVSALILLGLTMFGYLEAKISGASAFTIGTLSFMTLAMCFVCIVMENNRSALNDHRPSTSVSHCS